MKTTTTLVSGLILLCTACYCQNTSSAKLSYSFTPVWQGRTDNMPGNIHAFVENKGQYANPVNSQKVLYTYNYKGIRVLFTERGIIYTVPEFVPSTSKNKGGEERDRNHENEKHYKTILHYIVMEWENANLHPQIEATESTPYYFGALGCNSPGKGAGPIEGFRKITYHNLYMGTDVEFSFSPNGGIKYAIKANADYSASRYGMKYYSPDEKLNSYISPAGNLVIEDNRLDFEIDDAAPMASQGSANIYCSFKKEGESSFVLHTGDFNPQEPLVIDPVLTLTWQNKTFSMSGFSAFDLAMDQANNVYVFGADATGMEYVQQYSPAGSLNWTYKLSQYSTSGTFDVADMVCDKAGNTYIASPYNFASSPDQWAMVSLYPNGTLRYFNSTDTNSNIFETWNLAYSCTYSTLIQSGAPGPYIAQLSTVNQLNGNLNTVVSDSSIGNFYAGCFASNGYYYALGFDSVTYPAPVPGNLLACYDISSGTPSLLWKINSGYNFFDHEYQFPLKVPANSMASGCNYLYTSDGDTLNQRKLTDGSIINTVIVPGGSKAEYSVNSGVAVDNCGNVYIGSLNAVYVYDENLNPLGSYTGLPGIVLDVKYNNGLLTACGANPAFVAAFATGNCAAITTASTSTSCGGNSGSATAHPPSLCASNPPYKYLWQPGGQTTQTATGLAPGSYTVTVSDASCPPLNDTASVTVIGEPGFSASKTDILPSCTANDGSIKVYPSGGTPPYTYLWSNGATTQMISGLSAGIYICTIKDALGCTFLIGDVLNTLPPPPLTISPVTATICKNGGSVALSASGYTNYTWKPAYGLSCTHCANPVASPTLNITYTVTGTDAFGCTDSNTVNVQLVNIPHLYVYKMPDSCQGSTEIQLYDTTYNYYNLSYSWSPGTGLSCDSCYSLTASPTVTTIYTCTVSYMGCSDTVQVKVNPVPAFDKLSLSATQTNICPGDSTTLTVTGSKPSLKYYWYYPATYCYGCSSVTVAPDTTTTYGVEGYDTADGCVVYDTITIHVFKGMSVKGDTNMCLGSSATLTASGALSYQWSNGATTSSITVAPTTTTTYSVIESDGSCSSTQYVTVTVKAGPAVSACCSQTIYYGQTVTLSAAGGTSYVWSPSAGLSCDNCPNPNASPNSTTTYTVYITTDSGCVAQQYVTLSLEALNCDEIFVPDAFSPNNDGQNDILYVRGGCIQSLYFVVFDRWGNKVFESEQQDNGWDGKYKGQPMNTGTYVWYLKATLITGAIVEKKGNVALIR